MSFVTDCLGQWIDKLELSKLKAEYWMLVDFKQKCAKKLKTFNFQKGDNTTYCVDAEKDKLTLEELINNTDFKLDKNNDNQKILEQRIDKRGKDKEKSINNVVK